MSDGANEEIQVPCLRPDYCCLGKCSHARGMFILFVLNTLYPSASGPFVGSENKYIFLISYPVFLEPKGNEN